MPIKRPILAEVVKEWITSPERSPILFTAGAENAPFDGEAVFTRVTYPPGYDVIYKVSGTDSDYRYHNLTFAGMYAGGKVYDFDSFLVENSLKEAEDKSIMSEAEANQIREFFSKNRMSDIEDEFIPRMEEYLDKKFVRLDKEGKLPLYDRDRRNIEKEAGKYADKFVVHSEEPKLFLPRPPIQITKETLIAFIFSKGQAIEEFVETNIANNPEILNVWAIAWQQARVVKTTIEERMAKLTKKEIAAIEIAKAIKKIQEKGFIKLFIEGHDQDLDSYVKKKYPGFSIEGKVIEGFMNDTASIDLASGISAWSFTPTSLKLIDEKTKRAEYFLDNIRPEMVIKIEHKGTILYDRDRANKMRASALGKARAKALEEEEENYNA